MSETSNRNPRKRARSDEGEASAEKAGAIDTIAITSHSSDGRVRRGSECPYMDTINRRSLDFDAEAVCCETLSIRNVYGCLVCGRYFAGRGRSSPAYAHSMRSSHHLFINVQTTLVYCLPEQYEVRDSSLADIRTALRPIFTRSDVATLDNRPRHVRLLDGERRLRGVVGLDNLGKTDGIAVTFQLLLCARPVRDALLLHQGEGGALLDTSAELARRLWATSAFRAHVAPHAFIHLLGRLTDGAFAAHRQIDPVRVLAWLLNNFSRVSSQSVQAKRFATVLRAAFQGSMEVSITTAVPTDVMQDVEAARKQVVPFWYLTLGLPERPLFKDSGGSGLVTQVPLESLLRKYDGVTRQHVVNTGEQRSYQLLRLPPFLMLTVRRFECSKFAVEKNRCLVRLPVKSLRMEDVKGKIANYSLSAAVIHDGDCENGSYRIAQLHRSSGEWYEIRDMSVSKTMSQMVALAETYILLYNKDT